MTILYLKMIISVILGFLTGLSVVFIFNRIPAKWLCDYNEKPDKELMDPMIQRVKGWPWRWIYAGLFACIAIRLAFTQVNDPPHGLEGLPEYMIQTIAQCQLMLAGLLACLAMTIIALADHKYMIVPDQFVIVLAIASLGFWPFHQKISELPGGMIIGGGVMLIVALIGKLVYKKDVMGMGDVKLCASAGLCLGVRGILFVLAAGCFASGIDAAIGLARKKYKKNDAKPLGPWLCAAGIIYIFVIWPFYL